MTIWGNCVVHNEERFLWFAVESVINHLDKLLLWDTGSTDNTWRVIQFLKERYPDKIEIRKCGGVDKFEFTRIRQEMLDNSKCDWILVLDADEVWWDDSIKKIISEIKSNRNIESIVVPFYNAVGDLYHIQSDKKGKYELLGRIGHLTIRAISKKILGLHVDQPYGSEGFYDKDGLLIQYRDKQKIKFINAPYLHLTHLRRSSKEQKINKIKYDLGVSLKKDLPEVFFRPVPEGLIVNDLFKKRSLSYKIKSLPRFIKDIL